MTLFEQHNFKKDALDLITEGLRGFKRSHVARQLRSMELKKGRLTDAQV